MLRRVGYIETFAEQIELAKAHQLQGIGGIDACEAGHAIGHEHLRAFHVQAECSSTQWEIGDNAFRQCEPIQRILPLLHFNKIRGAVVVRVGSVGASAHDALHQVGQAVLVSVRATHFGQAGAGQIELPAGRARCEEDGADLQRDWVEIRQDVLTVGAQNELIDFSETVRPTVADEARGLIDQAEIHLPQMRRPDLCAARRIRVDASHLARRTHVIRSPARGRIKALHHVAPGLFEAVEHGRPAEILRRGAGRGQRAGRLLNRFVFARGHSTDGETVETIQQCGAHCEGQSIRRGERQKRGSFRR